MIKKYGWKYFLATIGCFFLGIFWPFGFFFCYMFNNEKDKAKKSLIKKLNFASWCWFLLEIAAIIARIMSALFEKGII